MVRPLSCVNELMSFEMSLSNKALATLSAVVPPLSCVDALMQLEQGAEAFVTQREGEYSGFLCGRGGEGSSLLGAAECRGPTGGNRG